jgi:hypothetical protein
LSVWKNSKNARPLAPSGIWAGKNSPKYLRFLRRPALRKIKENRIQSFHIHSVDVPAGIVVARLALDGLWTY